VLLGLAIGVTLGAHRLTGEVAEPILVALYSIPKVTLYPVILLIFGIGMPAKVAFGAIQGIVPVSLFAERTGRPLAAAAGPIAEAARRGLLEADPTLLKPTPLGRRFLNDLQALFLPDAREPARSAQGPLAAR
jgi:NitT/TauT family transport system permease protein